MTAKVTQPYYAARERRQADAETAEAIDFLEFYAREALRLDGVEPPARIEGEDNEFFYIPLGVGAVISPWNFPLAITAGMTAAAIVCGNTVVLKPSSDAPTIAAEDPAITHATSVHTRLVVC